MKQSDVPEAFPQTMPMYCVIDVRDGELVCNVEAADRAEAVRRAAAIAGLLRKSVTIEDLAATAVGEPVNGVPTFLEGFFAQQGLFGVPPSGTTAQ